ncbi:MAG: hypothetical protein P4L93_04345 [Coriobacteriia bacterium]|nr:hypothetical protein [Coriobacteriia bacterium]
MHGFFPGVFFFAPVLLFFGFLKIMFVILLIVLIVRLATHGRRHGAYAHDGYGYGGHGYGYGHDHGHGGPHGHAGFDAPEMDPRRVAAWRYAAGKIDRTEFDRIMSGLDATAPAPPTAPPSAPTPQA